jgi:hypothetical protein
MQVNLPEIVLSISQSSHKIEKPY